MEKSILRAETIGSSFNRVSRSSMDKRGGWSKKKIVIENSYLIVTTKKERYSLYSTVTVSDDKTRK